MTPPRPRNRYQITIITDVDGELGDAEIDAVVAAVRRAVPGQGQIALMSHVLITADDPPPELAARIAAAAGSADA